jgi:hypothetical protein
MNYPQTRTLLHISAINLHPQGDVNTKDYIILLHQFYRYSVKIYNSSYKHNNMDIMDSMMLTYSLLNFIYMPLFTLCVAVCIQTSNIDVFEPEGSSLYAVN